MNVLLRVFVLMLGMLSTGSAISQGYPIKPVWIITGFGPGGIGYAVPRLFAEEFSNVIKQRVIIDDKPGAGNLIGARAGAAASPDGYALFIGNLATHPVLRVDGVDVLNQMQPIGLVMDVPLVYGTTNTLPLRDVKEMVDYARKNPGKLNFASSGGSAYLSLMMTLLSERLGKIQYVNVPYKDAAQIQVGLMSGDVHIAIASTQSMAASVKAGKTTALLYGGTPRSPLLPGTPTPEEAGVKDFSTETLFGLFAPLKTPRDTVEKLSAAVLQVARDPAYQQKAMKAFGVLPPVLTPEQTVQRFERQLRYIKEAARISNYVPE